MVVEKSCFFPFPEIVEVCVVCPNSRSVPRTCLTGPWKSTAVPTSEVNKYVVSRSANAVVKPAVFIWSSNGECAELHCCLAHCLFGVFSLCLHLLLSQTLEDKRAPLRQTSRFRVSLHQILDQSSDSEGRLLVHSDYREEWSCLHGPQLQVSIRCLCLIELAAGHPHLQSVYLSFQGWTLSCWGGSAVLQVMAGIIRTVNTETSRCASQSSCAADCCSWCWLMGASGSALQVRHKTCQHVSKQMFLQMSHI